ncbi:effector-associated constant component EACC1 [Streptomyces melanogenes]|uniref:effector-associated constant component EACC1 n=1 Tax=Streptomyces melanogenes TaxID=67326 RepID=UPI0037A64004
MEVKIVAGGDKGVLELVALLRWLRSERQLSGVVRPEYRPAGPEDLSAGVLDVVSIAVGSGGVAVALAQSLTAWLKSRRPAVELTITLPDGSRYRLGVAEEAATQAAPLIEELLRQTSIGRGAGE